MELEIPAKEDRNLKFLIITSGSIVRPNLLVAANVEAF